MFLVAMIRGTVDIALMDCFSFCSYVWGHGQRWIRRHNEYWHFIGRHWHDEKKTRVYSSVEMYPIKWKYYKHNRILFYFFRVKDFIPRGISYTNLIDMQMDVRDMSFFPHKSFDGVLDKGISKLLIAFPLLLLLLLFFRI